MRNLITLVVVVLSCCLRPLILMLMYLGFSSHKYLLNIRSMAPQLNVYIKTHKENQPIRPVINNVQAPSYKVAIYINKKLQGLICLPYTYNTKNSQEIAEELIKLPVNEHMRIVILDIKDRYTNFHTVHTARVPTLHDCCQHNKAYTTRNFYIVCSPDDEHIDARNMLS